MALTPEEEQRLAELKRQVGSKALSAFGYEPNESADISAVDRGLAKTFASNPEEQLKFIKKNYPDLDVVLNEGEVFAKKKGASEPYKAMDPEFSPLSAPMSTLKDIPQDIAESLYDIAGGAAQGLATGAGALAGAPAGPVGMAAGGAAASAGSGAGIEGLRQMLGRALGVNEEYDPGQIGMAGAIGAIAPAAGAAVGKGVQAAGKGAKWLGKGLSKFTEGEAEQYLKNPQAVQEAVDLLGDKYNADIAREKAGAVLKKLGDTLGEYGASLDKELSELLQGKNVPLNIEKIRAMTQHLSDVPGYESPSLKEEAEVILDQLERGYAQLVQKPVVQGVQAEMPGVVSPMAKKVEGKIIPGQPAQPLMPAEEAALQGELFGPGTLTRKDLEASLAAEQGDLLAPLRARAPQQTVMEGYQPFVAKEATEATMMPPTVRAMGGEAQGALFRPETVLKPEYEKNLSEVFSPAELARRLKQVFGKEAYSKKIPGYKGKTEATSEQLSSVAEAIGIPINKIPGAKTLNEMLQQNIPLRDEIKKASATDPVGFLKSLSSKNMANLAAAARKTGDKTAMEFADQLGAARTILGTSPATLEKSQFMPSIGRALMRGGEKASKSTKAGKGISKSAALWEALMTELNKQGETSL